MANFRLFSFVFGVDDITRGTAINLLSRSFLVPLKEQFD